MPVTRTESLYLGNVFHKAHLWVGEAIHHSHLKMKSMISEKSSQPLNQVGSWRGHLCGHCRATHGDSLSSVKGMPAGMHAHPYTHTHIHPHTQAHTHTNSFEPCEKEGNPIFNNRDISWKYYEISQIKNHRQILYEFTYLLHIFLKSQIHSSKV